MSNLTATASVYAWKKGQTADGHNVGKGYAHYAYGDNFAIEDFASFISDNFDLIQTTEIKPKFPAVEMSINVEVPAVPTYGGNGNLFTFNESEADIAMVAVQYVGTVPPGQLLPDYAKTYYYYVVGSRRLSDWTLALDLRLDVLNTFDMPSDRGASYTAFTEDTLVIREHRDRWKAKIDESGSIVAVRVVDDADEGFSVPQFQSSREMISEGQNYPSKTYLIYKANEQLSTDNLENPLSLYIATDPALNFISANKDSYVSRSGLTIRNASGWQGFFVPRKGNDNIERASIQFSHAGGGASPMDYEYSSFSWPADATGLFFLVAYENPGATGTYAYEVQVRYVKESEDETNPRFEVINDADSPLWTDEGTDYNFSLTITGVNSALLTSGTATGGASIVGDLESSAVFQKCVNGTQGDYQIGGGVQGDTIDGVDRYDRRNVKVITCPYFPLNLVYHAVSGSALGGYFDLPEGVDYYPYSGRLSAVKPDLPMLRHISDDSLSNAFSGYGYYPSKKQASNASLLRDDWLESKRFHSSFHSLKYTYDDSALNLRMERVEVDFATESPSSDPDITYPIYYKQTNTIASKLAFALVENPVEFVTSNWIEEDGYKVTYKALEDYPLVMVHSRNNELPIFTSDFLDYMRYGYNYDKKANERGRTMSVVGGVAEGVTGVVGGVASLSQGNVAGGLNYLAGGVTGVGNKITAQLARDENLQRQLKESSNQSIGVSGSDDIDLFEWYSANKLWRIESDPLPLTLTYIMDLFHYYGYATGVKKVPEIHTRANFNFLQCDPKFRGEQSLGLEIVDELRRVYREGVTYLWRTENTVRYDFDGRTANIEIWAVE